jgi:arginase
MKNLPKVAKLKLAGPIYVSFDIDVLEPGLAPGVSHWEPGGLTTREALRYIQPLPPPLGACARVLCTRQFATA